MRDRRPQGNDKLSSQCCFLTSDDPLLVIEVPFFVYNLPMKIVQFP